MGIGLIRADKHFLSFVIYGDGLGRGTLLALNLIVIETLLAWFLNADSGVESFGFNFCNLATFSNLSGRYY